LKTVSYHYNKFLKVDSWDLWDLFHQSNPKTARLFHLEMIEIIVLIITYYRKYLIMSIHSWITKRGNHINVLGQAERNMAFIKFLCEAAVRKVLETADENSDGLYLILINLIMSLYFFKWRDNFYLKNFFFSPILLIDVKFCNIIVIYCFSLRKNRSGGIQICCGWLQNT